MVDYAQTDFFMDLSLVDDPYPYFEYLRAQGPVLRLPAHDTSDTAETDAETRRRREWFNAYGW